MCEYALDGGEERLKDDANKAEVSMSTDKRAAHRV